MQRCSYSCYEAGPRSSSINPEPHTHLMSLLAQVSFTHIFSFTSMLSVTPMFVPIWLGVVAASSTSRHDRIHSLQHAEYAVFSNRVPSRRALRSRCQLAAAWTALQSCSNCSSSFSSSRMSHRPKPQRRGQTGLLWAAKPGKGTAGGCRARDAWGSLSRSLADGPTMVCYTYACI